MKFKKPNKKELTILSFLLIFIVAATYLYGSRGFFIGLVIIYANALIDVAKQLPEIAEKQSKKRAVIVSIYFIVITVIFFPLFYKVMW